MSTFLQIDKPTADAIVDMDNHGVSEGLGPKSDEASEAWDTLVFIAELVTGRKADRNL